MVSALVQPQNSAAPDLIARYLESVHYKIDYRLDRIWASSAAVFHPSNSGNYEDPSAKFSTLKDLFQLFCFHSHSCTSVESILFIAPVIHEFYNFLMHIKALELGFKKEKKMWRNIKEFCGSVLGYVNVCCEGLDDNVDVSEEFTMPLKDLFSVWIWDKGIKSGSKEWVKKFFPFVSEDIAEMLYVGECGMSELCGHVIAESFILKCCVEMLAGRSGKDFLSELRNWAVGSLTLIRNPYVFDSLVKMLLQPPLPVTIVLIAEDELSLRKVLYDSVVLPEYSFLAPERLARLPDNDVACITMDRLLIACEAVELFRKMGDQSKTVAYSTAFSSARFPSQLFKWVRSQVDIDIYPTGPDGSSPRAFLKWILDIENRGVKIFDDDKLRNRAKLLVANSEEDNPLSAFRTEKTLDADSLFFIDNKGEREDENKEVEKKNEALSAAFLDAARSLLTTERKGRKRKMDLDEEEKQANESSSGSESGSSLDEE